MGGGKNLSKDETHTFFGLTDLVLFIVHRNRLGTVLYFQQDLSLAIHTDVAIAHQVHDKGVFPRPWRSLKLHLKSLYVEGRVALIIDQGFIEGGHLERWHCDLAQFAVREEDVPAW